MNLSNAMWHIVEVANCCLEIWLISFYLNKMLTRRPDTVAFGRVWYVLSVVALALTNAVVPNEAVDKIHAPNGVTWLNIASLGVTVLSMVLFTLFSFKDSVLRRIFTDGIFVVVIFATENLLGVLLLVFLGEQMDQSAESGMGRLIGMVGTKVLSFWAIMLISKFSEKKYSEIKTSHWLMMILMPVISTSILAVIYRFQLDMLNRDNVGALVISAFVSITGLLYLNYATFSHIESFANEMRLVVLEEVLEREEKNYLLLNNAYNEMRTLRHDFRNQISVAYDLITHGETKAAEQYLESLSGRITRLRVLLFSKALPLMAVTPAGTQSSSSSRLLP